MDLLSSIVSDDPLVVDISTKPLDFGPTNSTAYSILQGFYAILLINALLDLLRDMIRGRPERVAAHDERRVVLELFDQMHDMYKFCRLLALRPVHDTGPAERHGRGSWLRRILAQRARLFKALVLLVVSLAVEVALVYVSTPTNAAVAPHSMSGIVWRTAEMPAVVQGDQVLVGSFSRPLRLSSKQDNVRFQVFPSLSIERTDLRDFDVEPRAGLLANCSATETWRFVCRFRTASYEYQYKVRLDLSPLDDDGFYFVSTDRIRFDGRMAAQFVARARNNFPECPDAVVAENGTNSFYVPLPLDGAVRHHPDFVSVDGRDRRAHDVLATLVLASIVVDVEDDAAEYKRRSARDRDVTASQLGGFVGESDRPFLSPFSSFLAYMAVSAVSALLHGVFGLGSGDEDMKVYLQSSENDCGAALLGLKIDAYVTRVQRDPFSPADGSRSEPNIRITTVPVAHVERDRDGLPVLDGDGVYQFTEQGEAGWVDIHHDQIRPDDFVG